jgi:hypothetical protein
MFKKLTCLIFVLLFTTTNSYARLQTLEDANLTYDFYNVDILINEDGTSETITELEITLLRENARNLAAKFPIYYNSDSSSIDIIEAKTIFNDKEYPVTKNMIEDKSIGTNHAGFDDQKQIAISFPHSEVGTKIYLKYKERVNKTPIDKEFSGNYFFGIDGGYWKESTISINSAIDLKIKTNDPYKVLSVNTEKLKDKPDHFRKAQIKLIKPITSETINEVPYSNLNPKLLTYVSISSMDTWKKMGANLAPKYVEIQNQEMPKLLADIFKEASKEKDIITQINTITAKLNEKVQYFGSWQSHKGKFIPQDLALVASKQTGDCKDFSTITVKILKELGYQANVALVERSIGNQEVENVLPNNAAFNHAIVKVTDKDGKIYWIDPTNTVSMSDGLFPDIAGKHALVLDEKNSTFEKIPEISEAHSKMLITKMLDQNKTVNLTLEFLGEDALQLTGAELYLSKKGIEDYIYSNFLLSAIEENNRISSTIPSLNSRLVEPITISLKYKSPSIFFKSNLGKGYSLDTKWYLMSDIAKIDPTTNINDLYLGHPRTLERKTIIEQTKVSNVKNLDFNITTPFLTLSRQCYIEGENTIIAEKAVIHQSWIKNEEFNSEPFKKLQKLIHDELTNSSVILPN